MNDFTHAPPFDAANPRHVQRREKAAKRHRRQRDEALRWLMGDARGRRVVWDLLGRAGLFRSSMSHSAELTAFNEGRRDIGLALLADVMRLCPERYAAMQAEATALPDVTSDSTPGDNDDERDETQS